MFSAFLKYLKWVLAALIALLCVTFAVNNRQAVTLSLFPLPYVQESPLFFVVLLAFGLGLCACALALAYQQIKLRRLLYSARRRISALENEVNALKGEAAIHEADRLSAPAASSDHKAA